MVEPSIKTVAEVIERWRADALEFLRVDVPKILFIVLVTIVLIRLLKAVTHRLRSLAEGKDRLSGLRAQQLRTLSGVIYSAGVFVSVFLALLQILPVLGINMAPLLASAGIAGLAIGFGAQTLVHDVINGFFILMENQYEIGDTVRVGGVTGTVERMTLRSTLLRDDQGALSTIPNSKIDIVSNLTRDWAQVALHVSVAYGENSNQVMGLLKRVGEDIRGDPQFSEFLVSDPEVPGMERVSGNEVDYLMLVRTRPGRQYEVMRELRRRIKESFEKNHIQPGGPGGVFVMQSAPGKAP
ncbi:MAG: mechanosensitive ion channel family protein [Acidobacteriia bacterium]|nr:mechanosensitive ion channel family protein [Terriglobia bacterium]